MKATDRKKRCEFCGEYFYSPYGLGKGRWEKRKYCSKSCSSRVTSKGRSPWNKGLKGLNKGENHPRWKNKVSYSGEHKWINNNKKKRGICQICLKEKKTDWANMSGKYKRGDIEDWIELCRKCHKNYDIRRK